ncbi:MAG: RHS repeat-associated core domain-containing protein, partial [bacterium]|nr:RHS repeat-associated core domain-containing protein [bacterium]
LHNVTDDEAMPITVAQPVQRGKQARRRLMITTTDPPADGDEVRLTLEPAAAVDLFQNRLASTFTHTFNWSAADSLLLDQAAPEVVLVIVYDGIVEIGLTEEVDPSMAGTVIQIEGATTTWSQAADSYTLVAGVALDEGFHELTIDTQPLDLGGRGLDETFSVSFAVGAGLSTTIAYEKPDPRETPDTTVGNSFGFHGLQKDAETGLIYVRNRYYDPELGRFITTDSKGYVDGASMYQFAGYNPFNSSDPLGLENLGGCTRGLSAKAAELCRGAQRRQAEGGARIIKETLANPYVQGTLQVAGGVAECAIAGGVEVGSSGLATAGVVVLAAHCADLVTTGARTLATGEVQETSTHQALRGGGEAAGLDPAEADYAATMGETAVSAGASAWGMRNIARQASGRPAVTIPSGGGYKTSGMAPGMAEFDARSGVVYLDDSARETYKVTIKNGQFYDAAGELIDTTGANTAFSGGRAIFVMDESGSIYLSKSHKVGKFHHSSFLGGGEVAASGEVEVMEGAVKSVTRRSGHYQQEAEYLDQFVDELGKQGINVSPEQIGKGF